MNYEPQKGWMIVEREMAPKKSSGLVLPEISDPTSDEVFRVIKVNDFEIGHLKLKKGDLVALMGYIQSISYKGEKIILARQKDVIVKLGE